MAVNPFCNGAALKEIAREHPCFGGEAHYKFGRIHLPVSPECNIRCRFCVRSFNRAEQRPGVSHTVVTPERAVEIVDRAVGLCPELRVVGIAGPGDTLATPHALETFRLVHAKYPELILCLSTNGLLLARYAKQLYQAGVRTVTVTVNAVDSSIQQQINRYIELDGVVYQGLEAAERLIAAQKKGIALAAALGMAVKVNTVLVPGVNDHHIGDIAREVAALGAGIYNLIPLIPQGAFRDVPAPGCEQIEAAREQAEPYLDVFRHCKHCRADAFGVPGRQQDLSALLYENEERAEDTFSHG